jgi:hypothetical protein
MIVSKCVNLQNCNNQNSELLILFTINCTISILIQMISLYIYILSYRDYAELVATGVGRSKRRHWPNSIKLPGYRMGTAYDVIWIAGRSGLSRPPVNTLHHPSRSAKMGCAHNLPILIQCANYFPGSRLEFGHCLFWSSSPNVSI